MINKVPYSELQMRMNKLRKTMDVKNPEWKLALILSKINQYYLTGTMQDGMLIIPRDDEAVYWVRRSYERALDESLFKLIKPMNSYRDAAASFTKFPDTVYIETEFVPIALLQRLQKYFQFKEARSLDRQISAVRAVKSLYELDLMKKSGNIHKHVLEERVPEILKEGMSEAEFGTELFSILIKEGYHGISRFGMLDTEMILGQIGFGESSIYPSYFNGPGGNYGMSPSVPLFGSHERKLSHGDLVFVDVGCGFEGYHTDKTMTYMFGKPISEDAIIMHKKCVDIQNRIAEMLKPGAILSSIYNTIMNSLEPDFANNFMGFGKRKVKFLGHGVGLTIDEMPVIAEGFDEPLQENMVFAIEPKKGIGNVGMVGIENTFIVTPEGGKIITGDSSGLIEVY